MALIKHIAIPFTTTTALLLACVGAHAQSNVTISGMLDVGVFRDFDSKKNVGTIQRSNIAFSGSEDLGNGLAATFKLSHRLDLDTGRPEGDGAKPFWQGESTVGLKGGFGQVRIGRALDAVWANDWAYDPWYNFNRIASPAWYYWHYNYPSSRGTNNGSNEYGRLPNGIFYDSPTFIGFQLHLSGSFEDTAVSTSNAAGFSLNYDQGPISLMVAHSKNTTDDNVTFVGAKYTFGDFALMGAYDRSKSEAVVDSIAKVYTVGATYKLGATELKASAGQLGLDSNPKRRFYSVGADYWLSKRTNLYVSAARGKVLSDEFNSAYGVGIAHTF